MVRAVCVCVCVCVVEGKGRKGLFGHGISHTLSFEWFHSHHSFLLYNCLRLYVPWCVLRMYAYVCVAALATTTHRPILCTAGDRKLLYPQSPGLPEARDHQSRSPCELGLGLGLGLRGHQGRSPCELIRRLVITMRADQHTSASPCELIPHKGSEFIGMGYASSSTGCGT